MYNHILVPVDGSDTSSLALDEAIRLAKELKSQLRLVYVIDVVAAYAMTEAALPLIDFEKMSRDWGEKLLAACADKAHAAGVAFDTKCLVIDTLGHRVYERIEEEAKNWPADLIVIGTHGRRGVNRLVLGSVAEGVMRIATAPVLSIRGHSTTTT
jgi:nucleotide-binding universal stress UspA family protein